MTNLAERIKKTSTEVWKNLEFKSELYNRIIEGPTPQTFTANRKLINLATITNVCLYGGIPIAILLGTTLGGKTGLATSILLIPTFILLAYFYNKKSQKVYSKLN